MFLDYVAMSRDDPKLDREGRPGDQRRRLRRGRVLLARRRDGKNPAPTSTTPGRIRPRRLLPGRRGSQADPRRQGDPTRRQGDRPRRAQAATLERLQPGEEARLRGRGPPAQLFRGRARLHGRRRIPQAHQDLRPGDEDRLPPLSGQADRPRDRPHHGRRPDRQPPSNPPRRLRPCASSTRNWTSPRSSPGSSRSATSPDLGDVPSLQYGDRPGPDSRRVLRRRDHTIPPDRSRPPRVGDRQEVVDGDQTVEWEEPLEG